jgi:hypothetical protein
VAARRCPDGLFAVLAGAVSNLICEADNELRPLRKVVAPNVMIMKRFRYAGKPRQRSWVSRCWLWEAPVDGGGVPETGRGTDVVGGQPDRVVAAGVPYGQVGLLADLGNGPAVAVFDPVCRSEAQPSVVGPGDDHVSDAGPVSVGQGHFGCGR